MAHLFSKTVIEEAIKNIKISNIESKVSILQDWLNMYNSGILQKKSEKEFEGVYSESLFGTILGYSSASSLEYTREKEPRNESNGQKCDIGLGFYASEFSKTQAIVELKDAGTSLDRPQQRAGNLTPVQQAFKYKPLYNSKWVIVSNFFEIRLYTDTYQDFESFTLRDLIDEKNNYENFRIFYTLFHSENLIKREGESETERLLAKVRMEEEKISKEFYREYKTFRLELMRDIWKNNPQTQNADVIEKAQRIIDRIVFICFCEDRKFLPQNKLKENILRAKEIDLSPWETLKIFFRSIDKGSEKLGIPDGYNGGLFKADESIDNLKISDSVVEKFINLGRYDFSEDGGQLSVEILGHIFEQSISDIEEIRTQIENQGKVEEEKETEKKVSKRKKDGIFYTPAYIVEYIVANSLGKYLGEHEENLKEQYKLKEDITEKNYRKREIEAYTEYQKILQNVKVLDPACGSGAFLVRVFDFLRDENIRVDKVLNGENNTISMMDLDPNAFYAEILKNNIYGVDLNEESVEITKLSLWLKSAIRGKKLVTLDNNIKCGNSLIDDPIVAGDKAFNWNQEFSEIMANGGFDVIVGNPPYGMIDEIGINFFKKKYKTIEGRPDLYELFLENTLNLFRKNGYLSFILPNTLLSNLYGKKLREYLINNYSLIEITNFGLDVFEDPTVHTCIITIKNTESTNGKVNIKKQVNNIIDIQKGFDFSINTKDLSNNSNSTFDIFISPQEQNLFKKLEQFQTLGAICYIRQCIKTGNDPIYTAYSNIALNSPWIKCLGGKSMGRYLIHENNYYLKYGDWLARNWKNKTFYETNKIIIRETGSRIIATLDFDNHYLLSSLYSIYPKKNESKEYLKLLLLVINSKFSTFFIHKIAFGLTDGAFTKVRTNQLSRLPIPNISLPEQQSFIERADIMLTLNKELHEKGESFLTNISTKYHIEKVTRKLEKWWELDFAGFMNELKAKISLEEQEELMSYFGKRKTEMSEIVNRIDATDKEIDEMVFELYGLTEEERRVVLESNGK